MGERGAGGDHNPVEPQLPGLFGDVLDRVLRARVQVILCVHHPRQARRVLRHLRHVEYPTDVGAAVTDEHADARFIPCRISLRRVLQLLRACPARRCHDRPRRCRRATCLDDRFRYVLRLAEGTHGEDAWPARLQRLKRQRAAESVLVDLNRQAPGQVADVVSDLHTHRQHDKVECFLDDGTVFLRDVSEDQVVCLGVFSDRVDPRPHIPNTIALLGPAVVLIVSLAEGPHIHHEDRGPGIRLVLDRHDGFLRGEHAAYGRAVVVGLVARADALEEGDLLRCLAVRRTSNVAKSRPGSA